MTSGLSEWRVYHPTAKRLREARREGNVVRSGALTGTVALITGTAVLLGYGPHAADALGGMMGDAFAALDQPIDPWLGIEEAGRIGARLVLAFGGILFAITALAALVQVRPLYAPRAVVPRLARLRPGGPRRGLLAVSYVLLAGANCLVMAAAATWIAGRFLATQAHSLSHMVSHSPAVVARFTATALVEVVVPLLAVFAALAVLDLLALWWVWHRSMRMTRSELIAELRTEYGHPALRRAQKQFMQPV